jgi:hypothetical protein
LAVGCTPVFEESVPFVAALLGVATSARRKQGRSYRGVLTG